MAALRGPTKSPFPYVSHHDPDSYKYTPSSAREPWKRLGTGFRKLWRSSAYSGPKVLLGIIPELCDYTVAINDFCQVAPVPLSQGRMIELRNHATHALLSVPPFGRFEEHCNEITSCELLEPCRLGLLIYVTLIIMPLPLSTAPFAKLAAMLRAQLSATNLATLSRNDEGLVVWLLTMGAISSTGLPQHRPWYVSRLALLPLHTDFTSWTLLKKLLQDFLWFEATSDPDGLAVWKELDDISGRYITQDFAGMRRQAHTQSAD